MEAKDNNLSASLEDYIEAIFNLTRQSEVARSKDIANVLGVSRASVTGALRLLKRKRLINYKPYDFVTLTPYGERTAAEIARKHSILKSFLVDVLGVNPERAQEAACKAEHTLGPEVIRRLLSFIEFATQNDEEGNNLASQFRQLCKKRSGGGRKKSSKMSRK